MRQDTDDFIRTLAGQATRTPAAPPPPVMLQYYLTAAIVYVGVLLFFFGVRADINQILHSYWFTGEIAILAALVVSTGLSAMMLSFPDMYQRRALVFLPILPLLAFLWLLYAAWVKDYPPPPLPAHGIECLICIAAFSMPPAIGLFYTLRKQATIHYTLAGAIALLSASSIGCLALRLSEKTDSIVHLVQWHYLPMVGFALLGIVFGRVVLKW